MSEHHPLGASGASRWLACPGSVRLSQGIPDAGSRYADEGSEAHLLAELCLTNGIAAADVTEVEAAKCRATFPLEMREYVQSYLDYCAGLVQGPGLRFIEAQVDLSRWIPGCFGTVDFGVLHELSATLHVVDLKYGSGVRVDAAGNPQPRMYALGLLTELEHLYNIEAVEMHIVQPRLDHVSTEVLSTDALHEWARTVLVPGARAAMHPTAPLVPGEHQCRFCRAAAVCPARAAANQDLARRDFDGELLPPQALSLEEVAALLPGLDELRRWASDVQDYALAQAEQGKDVPGYKLVAGRSNRAWASDETATITALQALGLAEYQITSRKLVGIPAIEKALGGPKVAAALIEPLITKPVGKPALVPAADPRPALSSASSARVDFAETP